MSRSRLPHPAKLLCALVLAWAATGLTAIAAEGGAAKPVGQYVDLQPVGVPIIVDRQVLNYIFVNVRVSLVNGADLSKWRAKEPFFRDALVRISHQTPFVLPKDYNQVDAPKLAAALKREVVAITGPGVVANVEVTQQTPGRHVRQPRP